MLQQSFLGTQLGSAGWLVGDVGLRWRNMDWLSKLDFERAYIPPITARGSYHQLRKPRFTSAKRIPEKEQIVPKFNPIQEKIVNLASGNNGVVLHAVWKVQVVTVTRLVPDQKGLQEIPQKNAR